MISAKKIIVLSLILWALPSFADIKEDKRSELEKLGKMIESMQGKLNEDRTKQEKLYQELKGTRQNISKVNQQMETLHQKIDVHQQTLKTLQKKYQQYDSALKEEKTTFGQQVRAAYQISHYNYIDVLLSQHDPSQWSHALHYYNYLNKARLNLITKLRENIGKIKTNEHHALLYSQTLESLLQRQKIQKVDLVTKEHTHQQIIGELSSTIQSTNQKLAQLIENKKALERILKKLEATQLTSVPKSGGLFAALRGKLPRPTAGKISERFGTQIEQSELRYSGVLINAPIGQPVRAVYPGKVVFADWLQGFGLLLILDHGQGYMTLYGNNKKFSKKLGSFVESGEEIAQTGDSNNNHKPGLYFEVRRNGHAINPEEWFAAA